MNKDELLNLVPTLVALLAPLGAKYGFSASDMTAFLTGGIGLGAAVYIHWNMKKVPESSVVVTPAPGMPTTPPIGKTITGTVVG